MTSITVFVMLDACRPDYIKKQTTPFLHSLAAKGVSGRIAPTFGFEPDAAYLAGLFPDQAGGGAQFRRTPPGHPSEKSPFSFAKGLPQILNRLPKLPEKILRKILEKLALPLSDSPNLSTARIPFHLLHRFSPAMAHNLDHPDFLSDPTIFDLLRESKKPFLFHAAPKFRVTMDAALKRAQKKLHPPHAFGFFHIGNLDGIGHRYGPDSPQVREELALVDQGLKTLHTLCKKRFNQVNIVIMGDHGMETVTNHLDMETLLKKTGLANGPDSLYILDSTMARFWFTNRRKEQQIRSALSGLRGGRILTQKDRDTHHLNWPHNGFGDLIFLADPGTLIFPNHFQNRDPVKGMHGYDPGYEGQQAALIINGPGIFAQQHSKPADMRRVFPTLCKLLKIDTPHSCGVESLVTL